MGKTQTIPKPDEADVSAINAKVVLAGNNTMVLSDEEKNILYNAYCQKVGLDPILRPFDFLRTADKNGNVKEVIYCTRSGSQQVSAKLGISTNFVFHNEMRVDNNLYYKVVVRASLPNGVYTESSGVVPMFNKFGKLTGENFANGIMKCETKAKKRAVLDLVGLGVLSEEEALDIIQAQKEAQPIPEPNAQIHEAPIPHEAPPDDNSQISEDNVRAMALDRLLELMGRGVEFLYFGDVEKSCKVVADFLGESKWHDLKPKIKAQITQAINNEYEKTKIFEGK